MVELLEPFDDHVADDAGRDLLAAQLLQARFDLADKVINLSGGNRPLGAGEADALEEFVTVEFLAGAGLLDDEGGSEDGALVSGETLPAFFTFAPAPNTAAVVVGGIEHPGTLILAVRTTQLTLLSCYV